MRNKQLSIDFVESIWANTHIETKNIHLFSGENETLLLRWNAFFFFNTFFDAIDFVGGLDIDFDFFASERLMRKMNKQKGVLKWVNFGDRAISSQWLVVSEQEKNNENGNSFCKFTYFDFNQHFGYLVINLFA